MKNPKQIIKNGAIILLAFGLFILALFAFFALTENKRIESKNGYKSEVDKSTENSVYVGQTYVNQKYQFQITFPEHWDLLTGNNPHILQKAENGKNSIYVSIYEFEKNLFKKYDNLEKLTIKDVMSVADYKGFTIEGMRQGDKVLGINDRQIVEYFDTEINGLPAYGVKSSSTLEKDGVMGQYIQVQYDIMLGNIKYSITAVTPAKDFSSMQTEIENSINSFEFIR